MTLYFFGNHALQFRNRLFRGRKHLQPKAPSEESHAILILVALRAASHGLDAKNFQMPHWGRAMR
jgi:hypothetical protein